MASALERFATKLRFVPETGCLIWTAATHPIHAGESRTGIFKFEGKRWMARRWAAKFIMREDIDHKEVFTTCGDDLCVRHLRVDYPIINTRQHWLLVTLGYGDDEPDDHKSERLARERAVARAAIPEHQRTVPGWFEPYMKKESSHVPF